MKPLVLIQCGSTQPTMWEDALCIWNNGVSNHNWWVNSTDAESFLNQFKKSPNKILFRRNLGFIDQGDGYDFVLAKPFVKQEHVSLNATAPVDLFYALDWLNFHKSKSIGFGTFIDGKDLKNIDIIHEGDYYTREPWMGGHVRNTRTNEWITTDENRNANVITWFYAYKMDDLPIYLVVLNPEMLTVSHDIEFETEQYRFRYIDAHMADLGNQLLKPHMSKNAFALEYKWYVVKGESFEFDIGAYGALRIAYGESFPEHSVKVKSDLIIEHIEGTKYKATFKKGQQSAYLSFRLNTGNFMDYSFINSGNRLVYNIKITKHYEEE
jgi:hypothetical protein